MISRLLVLLWISSVAFAQAPGVDWEHQAALGSNFQAQSLREVGVGEVVAAGYTDVNFVFDVVVRKQLADGSLDWNTVIPTSNDEQGTGICLAAGGGYAVCGWTSASYGPADFILKFLTASGTLTNSFDYGTSDDEVANDIETTSDFGYIMCGYRERANSGRDFHLVKVTSAGVLEWAKTYGGPESDIAHAVIQTPDGGYAVVGETNSFGNGGSDVWLLRLDVNGDSLWSAAYLSADIEVGYDLAQTADGGFVIAGYQLTFGPVDQNALLIKTNSAGAMQWVTVHDNGGFDAATGINVCADGGFVLCGRSDAGGTDDAMVLRFDEIGQHYWTVTTGGASGDGANEIRQLNSGGYIYCGYRANPQAERIEWYVVKLLPDTPLDGPLPVELLDFSATSVAEGIQIQWQTASELDLDRFEVWRGERGNFQLVYNTFPRGNASSGSSYSFVDENVTENTPYDYYLVSVDVGGAREEFRERMATASWYGNGEIPSEFGLTAYPNPFNPSTTIEFQLPEAGSVVVSIFDNTGRIVERMERAADAGEVRFDWNAKGKTSGVYFAQVRAGKFVRTVPLVLLK
ncbi:MAG: T9SS type A sorting domain-containing protein [Calditrichaeota bacterium]|nr:T9SS type A sorting domain-containing protein [Calditrichota bacterium]